MSELQQYLANAVKSTGRAQILLARDSGLTQKHVSQALLDAAGVNLDADGAS